MPFCSLIDGALMWKVFEKSVGDEADQDCIPPELVARVMGAYRDLRD